MIIYGNKVSSATFTPNGECVISKPVPVVEILDAAMNMIDRIPEPAGGIVKLAESLKHTGRSARYAKGSTGC